MKKIGYKIISPLFIFGLLVFSFEANPALNENFDNSDFALTANKRYETPYFTFSHFEDPITKPSDFIGNKVRSDVSSRDKSDPTYLFNNFVIPNTHGAEMETIGNKLETDQSGHATKVFTTYSVSKMIDFPNAHFCACSGRKIFFEGQRLLDAASYVSAPDPNLPV